MSGCRILSLPPPSTTAVQISSVLLLGFRIKLSMNKQFRTNPSEESTTLREREQMATLNGRAGILLQTCTASYPTASLGESLESLLVFRGKNCSLYLLICGNFWDSLRISQAP